MTARDKSIFSNCRPLRFEPLESRRLLSTINWTNRGNAGSDSDGFGALFGGNANLARQVVDRAIDDWEAVISNFNYTGGGNTFNLQVQSANITAIANSNITSITDGKPTAATINVQNNAATHWLDPTPLDDAEFDDNSTNVFTAFAVNPGISGTDLYTTIIHEIGHSVGISQQHPTLSIASYLTDSGVDDPNDSNPTGGNLIGFNVGTGPIEATFTNSDPGHLWEGPATTATNSAGLPVHANDLMNPGRALNSNERSLISDLDATILQRAYGYSIVLPSTINNMLVNANFTTNTLSVLGNLDNASDSMIIEAGPVAGTLRVTIGFLQEVVPLAETSSIVIDTGGGNDSVRFKPLGGNPTISLNLGVGTNELLVHGATNGYDGMTLNGGVLTSTEVNITSFVGAQSLTLIPDGGVADIYIPSVPSGVTTIPIIGGSGIDTVNLHSLAAATPVTIFGNGGGDTINIAPGASTQAIFSAVTVFGGAGDDTINLVPGAPFGIGILNVPVTVNGDDDNDTLNIASGHLDAVTGLVTFNGGTGTGIGNRVVLNDTTSFIPYSYLITPTSVTRDPTFAGVNFSNTNRITLNCSQGHNAVTISSGIDPIIEVNGNDGNDNFVVGGGLMDAGVGPIVGAFNGGNGTDQITYDDHLRTSGVIWDVHPSAVYYGGIFQLNTTGFEAVGVLAGNGNDQIYFYNDIGGKIINVDAGGGDDLIDTNHCRALTLNITGGAGNDTLEVDDVGIPTGTIFQYVVLANQVYRYDFIAQYDVFYGAIEQVKVFLPTQSNNVYIASTTAVAWAGTAIYGNTSGDTVVVNARDGAGNATIQGPVYALVGDGADVVEVDATASSTPIDYAVGLDFFGFNTVLTGFGNAVTIQNSETIRLRAGGGNDTFAVNVSPPFAPPALDVLGGDGDDTVNIAQPSGNLANVKMPLFNYNGGNGHDSMYVYNGSTTAAFGYYLGSGPNPSAFTAWDGGSHIWEFRQANTESLHVYAGSHNDIFQIFSTSVPLVELSGQGGNDLYDFGIFHNLQLLQGRININGSGGSDTLKIENGNDTTGRTYHITQNTIGATPGDNLLGPGGSVEFIALAGAITINNGSGADTVFAQPNATAPISIHGGHPTTMSGDKLDVNVGGGENPIFTPGATGAGTYTFSNYRPLMYTEFESVSAAYPGDFNRDGTVGQADFDIWRAAFGTSVTPGTNGDGNSNGVIDAADYVIWRKNLGKSFPASASATGAGAVGPPYTSGLTSASTAAIEKSLAEPPSSPHSELATAETESFLDAPQQTKLGQRSVRKQTRLPHEQSEQATIAARIDGALTAWFATRLSENSSDNPPNLVLSELQHDFVSTVAGAEALDGVFDGLEFGFETARLNI